MPTHDQERLALYYTTPSRAPRTEDFLTQPIYLERERETDRHRGSIMHARTHPQALLLIWTVLPDDDDEGKGRPGWRKRSVAVLPMKVMNGAQETREALRD